MRYGLIKEGVAEGTVGQRVRDAQSKLKVRYRKKIPRDSVQSI